MQKRTIGHPSELDLVSPGRRDYHVRLGHDSLGGDHLIPLTVFVGPDAQPDQGLLVIGGTHGDEYEGPVAIRNLLFDIHIDSVLGRLIMIPVLNVDAFQAGRRSSPTDGMNLNRAFPGSSNGSYTTRLANFVTEALFPAVHCVMDLHAGGRQLQFAPQVHVLRVDDVALQQRIFDQARGHGTPLIVIDHTLAPTLLRSEAVKQGLVHTGGEFGWGEAVQASGVDMARRGVIAAAVAEKVITEGAIPTEPINSVPVLADASSDASYVRAPFTGLFEPMVQVGSRVTAGQPVGRLHDFNSIDSPAVVVFAQITGVVTALAWDARVSAGRWLAIVASELPWPS